MQRLGLWSLEERHNRADLLEVFKLKAGLSNIYLQTFFDRSVDSRTTGHSWKISMDRSKLDVGKYFFQKELQIDGINCLKTMLIKRVLTVSKEYWNCLLYTSDAADE